MVLIKAIFLDLDGTLVSSNGKISDENLETIRKVRTKRPDIKIVIATGTDSERAMEHAKTCEFAEGDYIICYNGGSIFQIKKDEEGKLLTISIKSTVLSVEQFWKTIGIALKYDAKQLQIYNLVDKSIREWENIEAYCKEQFVVENSKYNINKDFIYKTLLFFPFNKNKINSFVNTLTKKYSDFQISYSTLSQNHPFFKINDSGTVVKINPSDVNKGIALTHLCEKILKIKINETMACDDSGNDISMLKISGCSVAMGNATDETKKIAKFSTASNDNLGVSKSLKEHILCVDQIKEANNNPYLFTVFQDDNDIENVFNDSSSEHLSQNTTQSFI